MTSDFGFSSTAEQVSEGLDLSGQTWLVTGCSSGLGQETVRVLALRGAHVIGAARTEAKAAEALSAIGVRGQPLACELSEPASVEQAVTRLSGTPLRGIVANAGIMALPELQQKHGVELQFLTNHVGHFALIRGLLPQLEPRARVVVVSSAAHFGARDRGLELDNVSGETDYHPWRMYARSKLANILFARSLAQRFAAEGAGRVAHSLHPGVIATRLARHLPDPDSLFSRLQDRMKTIPQGAATQIYAAVHPETAGTSIPYLDDCVVAEPLPLALRDDLADELWDATAALLAR